MFEWASAPDYPIAERSERVARLLADAIAPREGHDMARTTSRRRARPRREQRGRRLAGFYADMTSLDMILGMLSREAVDTDRFTARDLYSRSLDCQNLGGSAVLEAIARAVEEYGAAKPGERVLDVGCGIGGPGRFLADRWGCGVVGVDLLPMRVELAQALAQKVGMGDRVSYRVADAAGLPFAKGEFSQVWMLDASIHVREKAKLFRELARVLSPGGLLVLHDMPGPLPRSMVAVTRRAPYHAPTLPRLIRHVEDARLRLLTWSDTTPLVLEDFEGKRAALDRALAELPRAAPGEARRRLEAGRAALQGYLDALGRDGVGCGFLVARRWPAARRSGTQGGLTAARTR